MRAAASMSLMIFVFGLTFNSAIIASAQPPLPGRGGDNLKRLPNDQVEGTIFEYKGTLKSKPQEGEEAPTLQGKFRIEGTAILDVSPTLKVPSKAEVGKVTKKLAEGKGGEVKLPGGPQQKRLGQYHKTDTGKMRLDFDDKDSLHGTMILTRKPKTDDVWIGTYTEKDGKKIVRTWQVEVRPIED
ncbi:MAG: hypothetical protein K8T91_19465 [Planctomycetes bacterium]|nr:hypothetical protein [Planctomycetota bacterium]